MSFQSLRDMNLKGRRVLLRADLNVPARRGKVTDTTRIDRLKPTIDFLREAGARILILSHFGRPEGEQNPEMSLAFLTPTLEERWGCDIRFSPDCIGPKAEAVIEKMGEGDVTLLENVRFYKEEKANDPGFAAKLAALGDIYVNDAFSAAHRAHASTEGLAHLLPSAAGLLMEQELNALDTALEHPQKPVAAIVGGSKISTKLGVLNNIVQKVDYLILGGAMANTFLYAGGADVGSSLCETDMKEEALKISKTAKKYGCEIVLPIDSVVVSELKLNAPSETVDSQAIPEGKMAIDVGPQSLAHVEDILEKCKTLLWNGPMGVFEIKPFDTGTNALAHKAAALTKAGQLVSIAGGGDTVAALENADVCHDLSYVSTAGGAFLEWLKGEPLPGVEALMRPAKAAKIAGHYQA
ncbi:MAG: phosphoglycerate kinase [Rhodospirillales bacterium]|nr:phosphoglycerate kinase [Rhodospirillales bacterium]